MTTLVKLRIILPIGKKPDVRSHLTSTYQDWKLLVLWASPDNGTMEMIVQLPPTVVWTEKDEEAFNKMCRGEAKCMLFWDRVFGEVTPRSPDDVISQLLSALQGLVGNPSSLQAAYEFHACNEHPQRTCPVCRAKRLYDAYG